MASPKASPGQVRSASSNYYWVVAALLGTLALAVVLFSVIPPAQASPPSPPQGEFEPGVLLVKFKPLVFSAAAEAILALHGFQSVSSIPEIGVQKVTVPQGQELETVAGLLNNPLVEYAEPDRYRHLLWVPNDPYYASDQWNLRKINMESAWNITQGSSNVKVAIVDTGFDINYNVDGPANTVSPWNVCDGNSVTYDTEGHGSHVTGTVAANTNNGKGVAGVAPGVSVMPVKVDCAGSITVSREAAGIRYAADNGAKVMNISLGGVQSSQTELNAINYAIGNGVLVVAAAGNEYKEGNPISYPAAYPGVLAVGASTYSDTRASYSQVQPYVAVAAPGGDASSSNDSDVTHWITSLDQVHIQGYLWIARLTGTSQAAPHVTGLAGLISSVNPSLTAARVTNIITSTAFDLGSPGKDDYFGWGRIDAYAALSKAQESLTPTPTSTPIPTATFTPTPTPTFTPTPIATSTSKPTATATATPTPTPHRVYAPTVTRNSSGW